MATIISRFAANRQPYYVCGRDKTAANESVIPYSSTELRTTARLRPGFQFRSPEISRLGNRPLMTPMHHDCGEQGALRGLGSALLLNRLPGRPHMPKVQEFNL